MYAKSEKTDIFGEILDKTGEKKRKGRRRTHHQ